MNYVLLEKVLNTPIKPSHEIPDGIVSIGTYFTRIMENVWSHEFDGKRPFGYSSWRYHIYEALIRANLVYGILDEFGYVDSFPSDEKEKADRLVTAAIRYMHAAPGDATLGGLIPEGETA